MNPILHLTKLLIIFLSVNLFGVEVIRSTQIPFDQAVQEEVIVLANDGFQEPQGMGYLQMGFIKEEKAGVWLRVPDDIPCFFTDAFRVLIGGARGSVFDNLQTFFQMGISDVPTVGIPAEIENAAQLTPGPYWNDIPAQGINGNLRTARAGQYIGAALEFTHDGAPSVYRDLDGLGNPKLNTLFAIPGGWAYSVQYGLTGDWVLRIVGHKVDVSQCE